MSKFNFFKRKKTLLGIEFEPDGISYGIKRYAEGDYKIEVVDFIACDESAQAEVVASLVRDHKLQGANAVCVLSSKEYEMQLVDKPNVAVHKMVKIVKWMLKLKKKLSMPLKDAGIVLMDSNYLNSKEGKEKIYAIISNIKNIKTRAKLLDKIDLSVKKVMIEELAFLALLKEQQDLENKALAIILPGTNQLKLYINNEFVTTLTLPKINKITSLKTDEKFFQSYLGAINQIMDYQARLFIKERDVKFLVVPSISKIELLVKFLQQNLDMSVEQLKLEKLLGSLPLTTEQYRRCLGVLGGLYSYD